MADFLTRKAELSYGPVRQRNSCAGGLTTGQLQNQFDRIAERYDARSSTVRREPPSGPGKPGPSNPQPRRVPMSPSLPPSREKSSLAIRT